MSIIVTFLGLRALRVTYFLLISNSPGYIGSVVISRTLKLFTIEFAYLMLKVHGNVRTTFVPTTSHGSLSSVLLVG